MDFFAIRKLMSKANNTYSAQTSIGKAYAEMKLLIKAGLGQHTNIEALTSAEFKILESYVKDLLSKKLPGVISPKGDIFIIDGNHDVYAAVLMNYNFKNLELKIEVVRDYQKMDFSMKDFKSDMVEKGWAELAALENPRRVFELGDNPTRSLAGMAFLYIEMSQGTFQLNGKEKSIIPFQGKYFTPRIQFRIMEVLASQGIVPSTTALTPEVIQNTAQLFLTNRAAVKLLYDSLLPEAPVDLVLFLKMRL